MTHNYKFMAVLTALFFMISFANAQRMVDVPSGSILSDVIHGDTTATGERNDDNTVYVLERDGIYEVARTISLNVPLQIKSADGAGMLPALLSKQTTDGTWPALIKTYGDMTLENISLSNQNDIGANAKWGGMRAAGEGSTVSIKGCHIEWDKAAALQLNADNIKVLIEDCRVSKMGNYNEWQGNGRIIDTRGNITEEIIIRNTTFYLLSDRIIRNMGGEIKNFVFDHNTGFSIQGRHGCLALAKVHKAQITNNLLINPMYSGNHPGTEEQTGPSPDDENIYIITTDTTFADTEFNISNNNFAFEQPVLDFFNTLDSVSKPEVYAPTVATIMNNATEGTYIEEVVSFTNVPAVPMDFLTSVFMTPNVVPQPDNFADNVGIWAIDCSYANTYDSYTAADKSYPLGDLNWFPEMKTKWAAGEDNTPATVGIFNSNDNNASLSNYPNPFSGSTTINYSINGTTNVSLIIMDATGKQIRSLVSESQSIGTYEVQFDASELSTGMYFYNLTTKDGSINQKMMIVK